LRFPGFEGEWETRKLGEVVSFKAGYAFKSNYMLSQPSTYQILKMSNVYQNNLRLDRSPSYWFNIDEKLKDFLIKEGDILLTLTGTVGKRDFGYSVQINESNKFLLNQRLVLLREENEKSINDFIKQVITTDKFLYHFFNEAKGGTGNQANVGVDDIKKINLNFPKIKEQKKIASFLSLIDERIATQNKIIEELKDLIKSVSEKLFSQKMRFDIFSDNWKVIALGDFLVEQNVKTKMSNEYRVLSSTTKGLFYQSEYFNKDIASKDSSGYKILRRNQLVFSPQNLWLGNINVNNTFDIGIVSPSYKVFSFDESSIIINYFKFLAKTPKMIFEYEQCSEQGASIVRRSLNMELFFNITLHIPTIKEQIKISDFLCSIDSKIEIEIQLLQKLEKQKEYLLKKLFV